jgi:hypothetical protein
VCVLKRKEEEREGRRRRKGVDSILFIHPQLLVLFYFFHYSLFHLMSK